MLNKNDFLGYEGLVENVVIEGYKGKNLFKKANKDVDNWVLIGEEFGNHVVLYNREEKTAHVLEMSMQYIYRRESEGNSLFGYLEVHQYSFDEYMRNLMVKELAIF